MAFGNWTYLTSLSGVFRMITVILGFPSMILVWVAYFSSSWTKSFPEIVAILIVEKSSSNIALETIESGETTGDVDLTTSAPITDFSSSSSSESSSSSSESDYDLISDEEEEYLDEILLQTLMYEKFFIGIVTVVFLISLVYILLRVLTKHPLDSPYEIMFDFIYHVVSALGLLTGSALVFLSAAKIQSFIDQVSDDDMTDEIIQNILKDKEKVQDKADKIAASAIGMLNGIFYVLCVITIRMTKPNKILYPSNLSKRCKGKGKKANGLKGKHFIYDHDQPRFSTISVQSQMSGRIVDDPYGFYYKS